jgi:hypothetical protein
MFRIIIIVLIVVLGASLVSAKTAPIGLDLTGADYTPAIGQCGLAHIGNVIPTGAALMRTMTGDTVVVRSDGHNVFMSITHMTVLSDGLIAVPAQGGFSSHGLPLVQLMVSTCA